MLILALGVGVNAAMFSLLDRVFFRAPSGIQRPAEIRRLYASVRSGGGYVTSHVPYPWVRAARDAADHDAGLAAYSQPDSVLVRDGGRRIAATESFVTAAYFSTLGVRAARGRLFAPAESDIAVPVPVAVISDAFWARAYGRDPAVLGRAVKIGPQRYTIVGIAPPEFTGIDLDAVDIWAPASMYGPADGVDPRSPWYSTYQSSFDMIARVRSVAEATRLRATTQSALRPVRVEHFLFDSTLAVLDGPIVQALGPMPRPAEVAVAIRVAGVSAIVLLIVVANVTNLLLLRTHRRRREIAVRRALGVSRIRLFQQMTAESVSLAMLGGIAAVILTAWAQLALRRLFFPGSHWAGGAIDARAVAFALVISVGIGVGAGTATTAGLVRDDDLAAPLKAGMKSGAYRSSRSRSILLALQTALCVVLLVGAGLFLRSLDAVRSIGTGFHATDQFFASPVYDEPVAHRSETVAAIPGIVERLRSVDGVVAVGSSSVAPLTGISFNDVWVEGRDSTYKLTGRHFATTLAVSPGFFAATGLPMLRGRDFANTDSRTAPRVAVVSAQMALDLWPHESAIGKCLFIGAREAPCATIVGIVGDARRMRVIEDPGPHYYTAVDQTPQFPASVVAVRARPDRIASVMHESEGIFRRALPAMVGLRTRTFDSIIEPQLRPWRLGATLFTDLGVLALVVAGIGVYSVIAYGVSHRTHEMGVRLALGATRRDIVDLVLADGLRVVAIGTAVGIGTSLLLGRAVASLLFGVLPDDLGVLIGAATVLAIAGSLACLGPGIRAARIDPMAALRAD